MDLQALIEELEEIVENSTKVPLSSKCMIDRDEVWEVIEQIRLNYPEEIKQAQWVKKERERILTEARQEANKLVDGGNQKVALMVNETEILRIAKSKADEILKEADLKAVEIEHQSQNEAQKTTQEAQAQAMDFKKRAQAYADNLLSTVEDMAVQARDTIYTANAQLNNSYQEADGLLEKITTSRHAIADTSDER